MGASGTDIAQPRSQSKRGTTLLATLEKSPALVLNADFRPLSYFPLSLWSWQDAVRAVFLGRVNVISEYDRVVRSPSVEFRLPSVIALKDYAPPARNPAFTRFNVFLRDQFRCQYCGRRLPTHDLTFDHVIPRSRGGRTNWINVVAACGCCNLRKANRTPSEAYMPLIREPFRPSSHQLRDIGRVFPHNWLHESWRDYLYWDSELETG
ncbi:HNH endonuclease [Haematospirillum jordaniae]|uniref:HNH endonuclease n=1 Tax=Haematospirillum TaxID=1804663 RepID=UPI0009EF06EE|nr:MULTISPECIES: HNH endonuclease [Haematospirillum]NKD45288.1 HNH endonuclease [Haematospirillum jordaniae]NKD57280.1 HNH endonuclease [Haematospirillum jordaniae]NKD59634.1 HNH endonuclease [Haematospirillum jordaniae]NKD67206.1 HNH endonuclease [Haematospirillum jordaniae]NKD77926.1 HNH endonuclease [Haematospirillum sp. H1815]